MALHLSYDNFLSVIKKGMESNIYQIPIVQFLQSKSQIKLNVVLDKVDFIEKKQDALCIVDLSSNVPTTTIPLEAAYKIYVESDMKSAVLSLMNEYQDRIINYLNAKSENLPETSKESKKLILSKENIFCYLIKEYDDNKEILKEYPTVDFMDMKVLFCIEKKEDGKVFSIPVTHQMMKRMDETLSEKELLNIALDNFRKKDPVRCKIIDLPERENTYEDYCKITTLSTQNGSAALLMDEELKEISKIIKTDFYLGVLSKNQIIVRSAENITYEKFQDFMKKTKEGAKRNTSIEPYINPSDTIYYYEKSSCKLKYAFQEISKEKIVHFSSFVR